MFDRNKSDEDGSSSSSSSDDDDKDDEKKKIKIKKKDTLKINEKFASRFEHNERRKEEHRLKEKVGKEYLVKGMMMKQKKSDGSSDSDDGDESSSSDEGDITETKEKQFVDVLTKLKNKDPSVYDPNAKLYDESSSSSSSESESDSGPDDSDKKKKKKKKKKMTLREVQARDLLEGGARTYESDDDEDGLGKRNKDAGPSYVEEQEALKKAFKSAAGNSRSNNSSSSSGDDDDGNSDSDSDDDIGGLVVKKRAEKFDNNNDNNAKDSTHKIEDENKKKLAEVLKDEDEFLKDYIVNRKWTDINADGRTNGGDSDSDSSEEDLERQEQFEHEYNFRFEEPGGTSIRSHARNIDGTLRREDTRRREKRQSVKERKQTERQKLMEEVKRLKNLKREEIRKKVDLISKIGGISGTDAAKIADLTQEFDPDAHDRAMRELYESKENDEAYQELEDEDGNPIKPEFDDDVEDELKVLMKAPEEVNARENERFEKIRKNMAKVDAKLQAEKDLLDGDDDEDDSDDNEAEERDGDAADDQNDDDDDNDQNQENVYSKRALKRWKKELQQKMDEFYSLDYEDFVDGLPTRFQYKEVAPSNYGLTTREILSLDDKDLNQIVSLKKIAPYREDEGFLSAKNRARARELAEKFLKQKRQDEKKRGDGKKRKNKDDKDDDDDDDDDDKEARMASYASSAWGKRNKSSNKNETGVDPNAAPLDTRSRNAKKNAKKRAKAKAKQEGGA